MAKEDNITNSGRKKHNVYFTSQKFGDLEFKQISFKELSIYNSLSNSNIDNTEFAIKIIFSLIIDPTINETSFKTISKIELNKIIHDLVKKNVRLNELFNISKSRTITGKFKEGLAKYFEEMESELEKTFKDSIIPSIYSFKEVFKSSILPQINILKSWVQQQKTIFDNVIRPVKELEESLKRYKITVEKANLVLKKYKWFVSFSLPDTFYKAVLQIDLTGTNKRKRINLLFIDYFSANNFQELNDLVEEWQDNLLFKPRMKIFRSCVKTLKNARSNENPSIVVIPTLIAQIDGILNEIIMNHSITQDPQTKMWIDGKGNQSKKKKEAEDKLIRSLNEFSSPGEYLLLDILFQQALPGQNLQLPTTFSRHKILHGEYINYGRMENTIRAFLILDFLHYL